VTDKELKDLRESTEKVLQHSQALREERNKIRERVALINEEHRAHDEELADQGRRRRERMSSKAER
jgi:regulator of replication initiation timing